MSDAIDYASAQDALRVRGFGGRDARELAHAREPQRQQLLPRQQEQRLRLASAPPRMLRVHEEAPALRELAAPLDPARPDGIRLALLLDITHHQHFLQRMQRLIWLTMGLAALATALLGAWAARASLRPLRRISATAANVCAIVASTFLFRTRPP